MKKVLEPYKNLKGFWYYSRRYKKFVYVEAGFLSDGATGAVDVKGDHPVMDRRTGKTVFVSKSWLVHDKLCDTGCWSDGEKLPNWKCSMVLKDILKREGRWFRDFFWMISTFALGGGKARENGMFHVRA